MTRFASLSAAYLVRIGNDKKHTNTPTTPSTSTANLCRVICFSTGSTNIVRIRTGHQHPVKARLYICSSLFPPQPAGLGYILSDIPKCVFHRRYPRPAAVAAELMTRDPPQSALVTWQASFSINRKRLIGEWRLRPGICRSFVFPVEMVVREEVYKFGDFIVKVKAGGPHGANSRGCGQLMLNWEHFVGDKFKQHEDTR